MSVTESTTTSSGTAHTCTEFESGRLGRATALLRFGKGDPITCQRNAHRICDVVLVVLVVDDVDPSSNGTAAVVQQSESFTHGSRSAEQSSSFNIAESVGADDGSDDGNDVGS